MRFVGRVVGNVLLVGFIIAGVVICSFSISDMVGSVSFRLDRARENHHITKAMPKGTLLPLMLHNLQRSSRRGSTIQSSLF